jgi:hypothetical protein
MATVLHLVKGPASAVALEAIRQQIAAGDRVTVVRLEGADAQDVPAGVGVLRVPDDLAYADLLDLVFAADQVIAW